MARKLIDGVKFSFQLPAKVQEQIVLEANRIGFKTGVRTEGKDGAKRRPTPAYLVNWVLCHFIEQTPDERERIVMMGRDVFYALPDQITQDVGGLPSSGQTPLEKPVDEFRPPGPKPRRKSKPGTQSRRAN